MELIHGGDWFGALRENGAIPLDLSANTSPLGPPERVVSAAAEALRAADRYPDPLCRNLRTSLASFHGVAEEKIVCGNGASDLIYRICRTLKPEKAALFCPGFAEYGLALRAERCWISKIALPEKADFLPPEDAAEIIPEDCELVFLCNPNNPTGRLWGQKALRKILERCRETGMCLIADECFLDFCEDAENLSLIPELKQVPELIVLRAFTKTWAMAGLRLGYILCGEAELAEAIAACGQPWAVSGVAQAAGVAALREQEYVRTLRMLIAGERPRVQAALVELGMRVIPGEANFLLFHSEDHDLAKKLRARGILIRDCANFEGLGKGWYRCAVRTAEENEHFLDVLREVKGHV